MAATQGWTEMDILALRELMHPHVGCEAFDALARKGDAELNELWRGIAKDRMGTALLGTTLDVAVRFLDRLSKDARRMMMRDMEALSASATADDIRKAQIGIAGFEGDSRTLDDILAEIRAMLAEPKA